MADKSATTAGTGNVEKVEIPVQNNIYTVMLFAATLMVATASVVLIAQGQKLYGSWWGESQELKVYQTELKNFQSKTAGTGFSNYDVTSGSP